MLKSNSNEMVIDGTQYGIQRGFEWAKSNDEYYVKQSISNIRQHGWDEGYKFGEQEAHYINSSTSVTLEYKEHFIVAFTTSYIKQMLIRKLNDFSVYFLVGFVNRFVETLVVDGIRKNSDMERAAIKSADYLALEKEYNAMNGWIQELIRALKKYDYRAGNNPVEFAIKVINDLSATIEDNQRIIKQLQVPGSRANRRNEDELKSYRDEVESLRFQLTNKQGMLDSCNSKASQLQDELGKVIQANKDLCSEIDRHKSKIESTQHELDLARQSQPRDRVATDRSHGNETREKELRDEIASLQTEIRDLKQQLQRQAAQQPATNHTISSSPGAGQQPAGPIQDSSFIEVAAIATRASLMTQRDEWENCFRSRGGFKYVFIGISDGFPYILSEGDKGSLFIAVPAGRGQAAILPSFTAGSLANDDIRKLYDVSGSARGTGYRVEKPTVATVVGDQYSVAATGKGSIRF